MVIAARQRPRRSAPCVLRQSAGRLILFSIATLHEQIRQKEALLRRSRSILDKAWTVCRARLCGLANASMDLTATRMSSDSEPLKIGLYTTLRREMAHPAAAVPSTSPIPDQSEHQHDKTEF